MKDKNCNDHKYFSKKRLLPFQYEGSCILQLEPEKKADAGCHSYTLQPFFKTATVFQASCYHNNIHNNLPMKKKVLASSQSLCARA